jgi:hypothetical protein
MQIEARFVGPLDVSEFDDFELMGLISDGLVALARRHGWSVREEAASMLRGLDLSEIEGGYELV